ncbi:MAG: glycosyltransferase family 4 protein [bacterium]
MARHIKICRVVKNYPRCGEEIYVLLQPYFLSALIEEQTMVITRKKPGKPWPLPPHAHIVEISYRDVPFSDYLEVEAFTGGRKTLRQKLKVMFRVILKTREITFMLKAMPGLLRYRPDIVHCHAFIMILPGIFSKIFTKSKLIVTLHSAVDTMMLKKSRVLRRLLGFADRIFCVSSDIKNDLLPYFPESRFEMTPNGVDLSLFKNLGLPRENRLIAVGTFRWYKGYKYLVRAMKLIVEKHPDFSLVICGDGLDRPEIEEEIRRLKLERHVTITGMISQERIVELLNRSKIYVMSSVVEGFPKALVEALACGAPAVLTTACAAGDVVKDTALTVEPENPEAFAETVCRLISDEELWRKLAGACAGAVEKYDWSRIAGDVKRIYHSLVPS